MAVRVDALAESERRPFANMVEVLLLAALDGRAVILEGQSDKEPRIRAVFNEKFRSDPEGKAFKKDAPVSPADVAATIDGVQTLRPHFRKDRPAVQCPERVAVGMTCRHCGQVVT